MIASAAFLGALGLGATFFPQELLAHGGVEARVMGVLVAQAAGALFLGFAMLDWMARGNLIGGIYSRPVAVANFTQYAIGATTLVKLVASGTRPPMLLALTAIYVVFAIAFGKVLFTHPEPKSLPIG